jgi:hypothetical protein
MFLARGGAAVLVVSLVMMWPTVGHAQTITDGRAWVGATMQARPDADGRWRVSVDMMLRSRDGLEALDAWHVRPAVGLDLNSHASAWIGYGMFRSRPAAGGHVDEHRYWQQLLYSTSAGGGTVTSRSRLEQRDMDGNAHLAWRLRQQVRFVRPVQQGSRLAAVVSDEVAVNLNSTTRTARGFDQNRVFLGASVTLSRTTRIETGYSNQFQRSVSGPSRSNHILLTTLGLTFSRVLTHRGCSAAPAIRLGAAAVQS